MSVKERFLEIARENIKRKGINGLLKWLETTDFFTAPASTQYHLSKRGGLCQHAVNVYEDLYFTLDNEWGGVDNETLETITIVALFHELCKIDCYEQGYRNVREDGIAKRISSYYFAEKLKMPSRAMKSVYLIQKFMSLTDEEAQAISYYTIEPEKFETYRDIFAENPFALNLYLSSMKCMYSNGGDE